MIYMIWSQDKYRGIGINDSLPWNIPNEIQHFKNVTSGKKILMGFNTYATIGGILKNRLNYVLVSNKTTVIKNAIMVHDYKKIVEQYADNSDDDIYVIGGKSVFELFAQYADFLIVSLIPGEFNCNVKIDVDMSQFEEMKYEKHKEFTVHYFVRKSMNNER